MRSRFVLFCFFNSQCSTLCGDGGVQTRVVVCRDARGHVTNACRLQDQPPTSRSCPSPPPCPSTETPSTTVTAPNRPPREKGEISKKIRIFQDRLINNQFACSDTVQSLWRRWNWRRRGKRIERRPRSTSEWFGYQRIRIGSFCASIWKTSSRRNQSRSHRSDVSKQLFLSYLFTKGKSIVGACVVVVVISSRRAEREKLVYLPKYIYLSLSLKKRGKLFLSINQSINPFLLRLLTPPPNPNK